MADTRVVVGDTGSLIVNILGLEKSWIDGNNITVPEDDAKITDIDIMPDVHNEIIRHSQISWKVWLPHITGEVVKKVEVKSEIGGTIRIAIEEDKRVHIRWFPPNDSITFFDWNHRDWGRLRTPASLSKARIDQIQVGDPAELIFIPPAGTHTRMELVSFGALFQFNKEPGEKVVETKRREKVPVKA